MNFQTDYSNYIIFNPEGKIKQLEYIKSTTSLGNTVVSLCNRKYGVFLTHNSRRTKLSEHQKKIFKINEDTLFSFSGITNDGHNVVDYLIDRSINEQVVKERHIHPIHVFEDLCYDASIRTIVNGYRLYGIDGLLMTLYDGVKLVVFDPKGSVKEVKGMSIGNRSQSCRTILEAMCLEFGGYGLDELIKTGITALRNAYPEQDALNDDNVDVWVLEDGKGAYQVESGSYLN